MSRLFIIIGLLVGLFSNTGFASPSKTQNLQARTYKRADCVPTPTGVEPIIHPDWLLGKKDTGKDASISLSSDGKSFHIDFPAVGDYQYEVVHVWLGTSVPTDTNPGSYPWASDKGDPRPCYVSGSTAYCDIPIDKALPGFDKCSGQQIYIVTHASVKSPTLGSETGTAGKPCIKTSCNPWFVYWSFKIKCGCENTPPPPTGQWCSFGTAFGYSYTPVSGELNQLEPAPNNCKSRWGWYTQLTSPSTTGILYVGAGNNNLDAATDVGDWTATISGGQVTVKYALDSGYRLTEVHVDVFCELPPESCAPGQYEFGKTGLADQMYTTNPAIPTTCDQPYVIVHGSVQKQTSETTCPPPKNPGD